MIAAHDPQDLERLLVSRENDGDVEGMVALYEADAVLIDDDQQVLRGHDAIRQLFRDLIAAGRKFEMGEQQPATVCGDLALTSTRSRSGNITAEVARRQPDGTWLWAIDRFSINASSG